MLPMNDAEVTIALRIPGQWSNPAELVARMPREFRFTAESLVLADGTKIDFGAMDADDQFAKIFESSCRQPPTEEDLAAVKNYAVNLLLSGPGGSLQTAHKMMQGAAGLIQAGGAGVFIDNSGLAHGGQHWLEMTQDGGPDALTFAFVSIVQGQSDVRTMGMHALGFRDLVMKRGDVEVEGFDIVDVIRYIATSEKPIDEGHIIADLSGPRFRVFTQDGDPRLAGSPMHNPFGCLKLVSMRDLAEKN
jgi:hypothetical protein